MIEFPAMVVKYPGTMERFQDGVYDWRNVANEDELQAAIADGFHIGTDVAKAAHTAEMERKAEKSPEPIPPDNAPPTRAELETKAKELGIAFDGRTSDKKLTAQIADKLKA